MRREHLKFYFEQSYVDGLMSTNPGSFPDRIFESEYVSGVLGIEIPLHESYPYSEDLRALIIQEQLQLENFFKKGFDKLAGPFREAGLAIRYVMEDPSRISDFVDQVVNSVQEKYNQLKEWVTSVADIAKNLIAKFQPAKILSDFCEQIKNVVIVTYDKITGMSGWKAVIFAMFAAVGVNFVVEKLQESDLLDFDLIEMIQSGVESFLKAESLFLGSILVNISYDGSLLKEEEEAELEGMPEGSKGALKNFIKRITAAAKSIGAEFLKGMALDAIAGIVSGGVLTVFKTMGKIFAGAKKVWAVLGGPISAFVSQIKNREDEEKEADLGLDDPTDPANESVDLERLQKLAGLT